MCVPGPPLVYYATLDFCCDDKYFDESANSKKSPCPSPTHQWGEKRGECKEPAPVAAPAPAPVASLGRSVTADAGGNVTKLDLSGTTCKLESKCLLIEPHYASDLCCASQASLAPLEDAQV